MPERAEIEAAAEAIRDTYVALGTRSGLFGSVGLLDERSRIRIAEVILDRVRDARGDDKGRWIEPHDALKYELGDPMDDERAARSPQGEDHDQPFSGQAADDIVESQGEGHEAARGVCAAVEAAFARRAREAPPYPGPRRWLTCPECGSTDEASDTPCTNLGCPSHDRRGNVEALRERAEMDGTAARSPQGEDHEAVMQAIMAALISRGWTFTVQQRRDLRAALSCLPSRDGTVAAEQPEPDALGGVPPSQPEEDKR